MGDLRGLSPFITIVQALYVVLGVSTQDLFSFSPTTSNGGNNYIASNVW